MSFRRRFCRCTFYHRPFAGGSRDPSTRLGLASSKGGSSSGGRDDPLGQFFSLKRVPRLEFYRVDVDAFSPVGTVFCLGIGVAFEGLQHTHACHRVQVRIAGEGDDRIPGVDEDRIALRDTLNLRIAKSVDPVILITPRFECEIIRIEVPPAVLAVAPDRWR